jgi:cobalt-zinc-cadmium efflux system protein
MSHDHHHHHGSGNIRTAFFLNASFTLIELVGGILTGSMAILSDAVHDLGDSLSLGLSWWLDRRSKKAGDETFSLGYRRFSLLGALINSLVLTVGSIVIITEVIPRLFDPSTPHVQGMLGLAILGVIVNGAAVFRLKGGETMNEQVLSWHLLEDVLGWFAVLIVSIVLMFWELPILDPLLALLITAFILFNVIRKLIGTMEIFLQKVPKGIDLPTLKRSIEGLEKVESVHHTHIWSQDGAHPVISLHIVTEGVDSLEELARIKREAKKLLQEVEPEHLTIEMEVGRDDCSLKLEEGE